MSSKITLGFDAHTIGNQATGNEVYAAGLIEGFRRNNFKDLECVYYVSNSQILQSEANVRSLKTKSSMLRLALTFPYLLRRDQIQIAHFQYIAPLFLKTPFVLTVHDLSYLSHAQYFPYLMRKRLQWMVPLAVKKASHIVTVSESSKNDLIREYGLSEEKVSVVYNGVADIFFPASEIEEQRVREKYDCTTPYFLVVGALQPRKNLRRVIQTYAKLVKNNQIATRLVIAGPRSWKHQSVDELVKKLGIESYVKITGYVPDEDLVALYSAAKFSIYASLFEGFGLPIVESMACGTPVITSNTSSMPEVAADAALLVDPQDDQSIADAILMLDRDMKLREQLKQRGLLNAKRFSWKNAAQRMYEIYKQVAGQHD